LAQYPKRTHEVFLRLYVRHGDHIRCEAGGDIVLIKGLRVLLPPYKGSAMRLYRGQGALKPRSHEYGLSWSASREVAEAHANGMWRSSKRSSVLLEALAPAEAIICHIEEDEDRYGEEEYLVDRRRLHRVRVVKKYAHTFSVRESSSRSRPSRLVGFEPAGKNSGQSHAGLPSSSKKLSSD
jgi:hypothetical protein